MVASGTWSWFVSTNAVLNKLPRPYREGGIIRVLFAVLITKEGYTVMQPIFVLVEASWMRFSECRCGLRLTRQAKGFMVGGVVVSKD